jgi:hypothetical protein
VVGSGYSKHTLAAGVLAFVVACGGAERRDGPPSDGPDGGGISGSGGSGGANTGGFGALSTGGGGVTATGGIGGVMAQPTHLTAADFDQTCSFDSDCVMVVEGDQCECRACAENAAVRKSAAAAYAAASGAIDCGVQGPCDADALPCRGKAASCFRGKCSVHHEFFVDSGRYDNSCLSDIDCTIIRLGEVCSPGCSCDFATIGRVGLDQFKKDIDTFANCFPNRPSCDCPPPGAGCSPAVRRCVTTP